MRKIILICSIVGTMMFCSCAQRVNVTQQGTTYNDFEASKYRKIDKTKSSYKPKSTKKKKSW